MKNKLLKGAHLSERKYREILELFCDDLTATQIADISGVSRVTINNYFRLIRGHIATYCDCHHLHTAASNLEDKRSHGTFHQMPEYSSEPLPAYFGLCLQNGKIGTSWFKEMDPESIHHLRNLKTNGHAPHFIKSFEGYHAVADCNEWHLYWLSADSNSTSINSMLSEISGFWSHTKGRLHKFRGMNKKMLYLHIKECEFRYNFRNDDILATLVNIINSTRHPQHSMHESTVLHSGCSI